MEPDKKALRDRTVSSYYMDGFTQGTELDEIWLITKSIII